MTNDSMPASLTERLRKVRDILLTDLVERDVAIRLALLAALSGEHLLLVGPPGTAKSLLARRLRLAFRETTYFERLLTRFTVPEELFGPLSIKGLEEDRYERLTTKYLPWASVAFLDEIFKANSAILNALLTLLNEREFDNGTRREKTPLLAVIGASNELPKNGDAVRDGQELEALFDRFLLRLHVSYVTAESFPALLSLSGESQPTVPLELQFTAQELREIQAAAQQVSVPSDVMALLKALRDFCIAEKISVSDRRWRKILKLMQVSAFTNGRKSVSVWDGWLLQHCVWESVEQREKVYRWYADRVGASAAMDPSRLTKIVVSWEARLKADQESRTQKRDGKGRPLFRGADGKQTTSSQGPTQRMRGKEPLFLAPPGAGKNQDGYYGIVVHVKDRENGGKGFTEAELNELVMDVSRSRTPFSAWKDRRDYLANPNNWFAEVSALSPVVEPTRHKPLYVDASLRELEKVRTDVSTYRSELAAHQASLENQIRTHLWVTPDFADPAVRVLGRTAATVEQLMNRIDNLRCGFEQLPREVETALVPDDETANAGDEAEESPPKTGTGK